MTLEEPFKQENRNGKNGRTAESVLRDKNQQFLTCRETQTPFYKEYIGLVLKMCKEKTVKTREQAEKSLAMILEHNPLASVMNPGEHLEGA